MDTVSVAGIAGMLVITWKIIDFLRLLANANVEKSAIFTQLLSWVGAIAVVLLYAASDLGDFAVPGTEILVSDAGAGTLALLGIGIGSGASGVVDFKQAIDRSDSSVKPPLVGADE